MLFIVILLDLRYVGWEAGGTNLKKKVAVLELRALDTLTVHLSAALGPLALPST